MTNNRSISPPSLPIARSSVISEFVSVTLVKVSSDYLYNISYLLKDMCGDQTSKHSLTLIEQQTVINIPMHELKKTSQFHLNRLKNKEHKCNINQSSKRFHRRQQKLFKSEKDEKYQFNNAAYCVAYCTIIIIERKGVTIGGWIGGLFELITGGHNGCTNEYRGNFKCQIKYASLNVTTHCINIFYKKSIPNNSPYICLCRFLNNSKSKYRDCEFLYAKIQ